LLPIDFLGQWRVRVGQRLEMGHDVLVRDDLGAGVLERLAAGDVIVVVMAVHQVLDRLVGDLLDLVDILLAALRPAVGHRIGRDHAILGDDEHRLMVAVAENVNVVGAVDLLGLDLRSWRLRLCQRRTAERDRQQHSPDGCDRYPKHVALRFSARGERTALCDNITSAVCVVARPSNNGGARLFRRAPRHFCSWTIGRYSPPEKPAIFQAPPSLT